MLDYQRVFLGIVSHHFQWSICWRSYTVTSLYYIILDLQYLADVNNYDMYHPQYIAMGFGSTGLISCLLTNHGRGNHTWARKFVMFVFANNPNQLQPALMDVSKFITSLFCVSEARVIRLQSNQKAVTHLSSLQTTIRTRLSVTHMDICLSTFLVILTDVFLMSFSYPYAPWCWVIH